MLDRAAGDSGLWACGWGVWLVEEGGGDCRTVPSNADTPSLPLPRDRHRYFQYTRIYYHKTVFKIFSISCRNFSLNAYF